MNRTEFAIVVLITIACILLSRIFLKKLVKRNPSDLAMYAYAASGCITSVAMSAMLLIDYMHDCGYEIIDLFKYF